METIFEMGRQPCKAFNPTEQSYFGTVEHQCYKCSDRNVAWCGNCYKDHHAEGYESCGTPVKEIVHGVLK